ncbi:baseplate multidomain protein megatron [Tranquillimonas alkanivorans]|uniref:Putative phage tail protein n=1 Tax=Tranquillimonas alkanivorans TaxID=441119 RepID=A0A1I5QRQ3_9RHOB|nr:glycoside hydrolase/phage tail family protein [Tranquillimonas alkanivorans]SFP48711.1 Putative phage tail protein [Tranquillimonas alkanivorans]
MATIVLSAAGAALGASVGGSVLGLSSVVIGRAAGATLGRVVDQSLMGAGSRVVETGKVDRFRLTGAGEGAAVPRLHGRMRLAGQVIWATRFLEHVESTGGSGKGAPSAPTVREHSYTVSLAVALCEGEIGRVGRIWADGQEIEREALTLRVYPGSEDQLPDPKIEAVEGAGMAPAYRGIAYVVIEDLDLSRFGNRVPQLSFEVSRTDADVAGAVQGVAMMPGTGEYALATTPVYVEEEAGVTRAVNVNTPLGGTDFAASVEALCGELPACGAVSLVVSWFGDDLRCGACRVQPKVERGAPDGSMPWTVSGIGRAEAGVVPVEDGRVVYGGTPCDRSVMEAIAALRDAGQAVTFYPFLLMEQMGGNGLADPWGGEEQPALPWRGRITCSVAPGREGSPDGTAAAEGEVAAFFGTAVPGEFSADEDGVSFAGTELSYRRFILHYAHLCAAAGGVDAFCVGSEMRSLTQVRGAGRSFPAVEELRRLAAEVKAILPGAKVGYAADWSEYFGYRPQDGSGDVYFHLDPLWADEAVDFVGIDNYMPLSDWRDGDDHADASWGAVYDLGYLKANVAGGEGYDWYYPSPEAREVQRRAPITDGAHGEPWVFRYKDIRSWWSRPHHERIGGVRSQTPTAWIPGSKPVWFTEFGCPAVDKGTNQPNKFLDPKSSETGLPRYSTGRRDDLMQMQYLRAVLGYWSDPANNPVSEIYGGPMVEMSRAHVWAWDARPHPFFPGNLDLWADGENWARGHWITGRATHRGLDSVVREVCGVPCETPALFGVVRGYAVDQVQDARAEVQPLMLAHGFDALEREGVLSFRSRDGRAAGALDPERLAVSGELEGDMELLRAPEAETAGRVRVAYVGEHDGFAARVAEAVFPGEDVLPVGQTELPMVLTGAEAKGIAERWLAEARVARDGARFAVPPSALGVGAGDVVELKGQSWRIDRVEQAGVQLVEAVRTEPGLFRPSDAVEEAVRVEPFVAPVPVLPVFLDLPLLTGDEVPHAPHVAAAARPWPGSVAIYESAQDEGYALDVLLPGAAVVGVTETPLMRAVPGVWDRGAALRVRLVAGALGAASQAQVLAGANGMAIGSGTDDDWEVFQFARAELVAPRTYDLSLRLRGQAGTDALVPEAWPAGSRVVLLDGRLKQLELMPAQRGLARHYRIGPAGRSYDDPVYRHEVRAFEGVGLRPYAPVHVRAAWSGGALKVAWVRRTRIEGDGWGPADVPLGEAVEAYLVRVVKDGAVVAEARVSAPEWVWEDPVAPPFAVEVAQISDRFGPGLFRRSNVDG